jgi:DNA-binding response OmpR family regulator
VSSSKILVIDDSRVIRKTVRDMLPDGDFEVIEAKDGVEGINLVGQERPSLIMLDFILPKLSGWEVFQQIQSHPDLQKIPLVLMSGKKEEVTSKISEPFEYFEFIEKPFDRVILADAIRAAMTKARKARPQSSEIPVLATTDNEDRVSGSTIAIAELQSQLAHLQKVTSGEIQDLQSQLLELNRSKQAEIQELKTRIEELERNKNQEIQVLNHKTIELETEIDTLKKQLGQLVVLIKKKMM